MCGRFIVSYTYDELCRLLEKDFNIFDYYEDFEVPKYNIAPTQKVISLISNQESYRVGYLTWGLTSNQKTEGQKVFRIFNSRVESIGTNKIYKDTLVNKRCIIVANGYYEWKKSGNSKIPYLFQYPSKEIFYFAGIWNQSKINQDIEYNTSILTKPASNDVMDVHDRMPVIFNLEQAKKWLNRDVKDETSLFHIISESNVEKLQKIEVSSYVNNVKNDSIECIKQVEENTLFTIS